MKIQRRVTTEQTITVEDLPDLVNEMFYQAKQEGEGEITFLISSGEYYARVTDDGYSYIDLPNKVYMMEKRTKEVILSILTKELFLN